MQATIIYLLTEQAQREQMKATGQPVARKQTMTEEIPAAWLDSPYCQIAADGAVAIDLTKTMRMNAEGTIGGYGHALISGELDAQPASGLAAIETLTAKLAAKQQELQDADQQATRDAATKKQQEIERFDKLAGRFMADTEAVGNIRNGQAQLYFTSESLGNFSHTGSGVTISAPQDYPELEAEIIRRQKEKTAKEEEAKRAKEFAKQEYISDWMAANAGEDDKQQFADGLLSRKVIITMIADQAFTASGVPAGLEYNTCDDRGCPCGSQWVETLPRSKYQVWRKLKDAVPEGTSYNFKSFRECLRDEDGCFDGEGESAGPQRYAVEITMPVGPFEFERTVEL